GGVRAIRYALEAGPVEVLANDHSEEACEAIRRSALLSGITTVDVVAHGATPPGASSLSSNDKHLFDTATPVTVAAAAAAVEEDEQ
ncbi:unnamed protein product, partial [Ectocarpus sp. 12 AP-2014]